jgi:hypothetical protein
MHTFGCCREACLMAHIPPVLRSRLRRLLDRSGYVVRGRQRDRDMAHQLAALYRLALDRLRSEGPARAGVAGIVFSKDRPMQLAALLESHAALVSRPCPLTVLFQASTDEFAAAYRELRGAWGGRGVAFTAQEDFRADLIRMHQACH